MSEQKSVLNETFVDIEDNRQLIISTKQTYLEKLKAIYFLLYYH